MACTDPDCLRCSSKRFIDQWKAKHAESRLPQLRADNPGLPDEELIAAHIACALSCVAGENLSQITGIDMRVAAASTALHLFEAGLNRSPSDMIGPVAGSAWTSTYRKDGLL